MIAFGTLYQIGFAMMTGYAIVYQILDECGFIGWIEKNRAYLPSLRFVYKSVTRMRNNMRMQVPKGTTTIYSPIFVEQNGVTVTGGE